MATLILNLSADLFQGPPTAGITIDGAPQALVTVSAVHGQASQAWSANVPAGAHKVVVVMTNDLYAGPGQDRNLYLDSATLDGASLNWSFEIFSGEPKELDFVVAAAADNTALLATIADLKASAQTAAAATLAAIADVRADMDASIARVILAVAATVAVGSTTPPAAVAAPLNTVFPAGWTALTLTPADSLQAAFAAAGKGFVATLAPGTYKQVANIPQGLDGWQLVSATGNPNDVKLDFGGGLQASVNEAASIGTPGRLSQGKGGIHAGSPGTVRGIHFTGGGPTSGASDLQAGLYWDCSGGTGAAIGCMFVANMNGIASNTQCAKMAYVIDGCFFNGNGADEHSHDVYLNSLDTTSSLLVTRSIFPGSNQGNDIKARLGVVTISKNWLGSQNANRVIDCADGAALVVDENILVGNDAGQNFFANGEESTSKGPGNTTFTNNKVYVGNRTQDLLSAGTVTGLGNLVFFSGPGSNLINSKGTGLADMPATNPTPGQFTPLPPMPAYPLVA